MNKPCNHTSMNHVSRLQMNSHHGMNYHLWARDQTIYNVVSSKGC